MKKLFLGFCFLSTFVFISVHGRDDGIDYKECYVLVSTSPEKTEEVSRWLMSNILQNAIKDKKKTLLPNNTVYPTRGHIYMYYYDLCDEKIEFSERYVDAYNESHSDQDVQVTLTNITPEEVDKLGLSEIKKSLN